MTDQEEERANRIRIHNLAVYSDLMRRVSVDAYLELEHDDSFPEDDGTLESIHNLESYYRCQSLEFVYNSDTNTWSLEPIQQDKENPNLKD